jgi:uncharacterized membrane protein YdjX (TVP38/TMEM64 family)
MPALVSMVGVWFLPHIIALFERAGEWTIPLFTVITAVCLTLALMPSIVMAALAGALFGLPGLLPAVTSYLLACIAAFEIVRRSARPAVQAAVRRSSRGRAILEEFQQATLRIIILSRLSPGLPFALMNVVLGVSPVARSTYVWGTLLGMLPRTLIWVAVGAAARPGLAALREGQIPSTPEGILGLALPILAAVGVVGLSWYGGKAIRRALAMPESRGEE